MRGMPRRPLKVSKSAQVARSWQSQNSQLFRDCHTDKLVEQGIKSLYLASWNVLFDGEFYPSSGKSQALNLLALMVKFPAVFLPCCCTYCILTE